MPILAGFIMPHPPIILPEVGKGEETKIQKTADSCREVSKRIKELRPDTIVITSPHSITYADYFHISPGKTAEGSMVKFGASQVNMKINYDEDFVKELEKQSQAAGIYAGTLGEKTPLLDHGTLVPLKFIAEEYSDCKYVRIGLSGMTVEEHYKFGMSIAETAEKMGKRIVFIASGDLSHKLLQSGPYGYSEEGVNFDKEITQAMSQGDFLRFLTFEPDFSEKAAECGLRSFIIMAGTLDGKALDCELLSYQGTFGVGYAVASFIPKGEDSNRRFLQLYKEEQEQRMQEIRANEDEYVRLARYSAEFFINTGKTADLPKDLPKELTDTQAGVFVSLKKHGELRGCIGTIAPATQSVAEEILENAVSSVSQDPRFQPVTPEELPHIVYSVDVLSPAEPIESADMLDVKRYGVIVSSGHKRGLLLPNLTGIDTVAQQISIALQKAGINPGEKYSLERFEVVRHT